MLVSITLTAATACTARACTKRLDETQWPETRDETLVRLETFSRLRRLDRDHIPDNCSFASQKLRYLHAVISAVVIAFVVTLVTCVNKMLLLN